ncbi:gliding motility lipoprotein GldH [Panacibacter sp. KCS-6]|uniref:Gliding motility lipoprotein GldH n=1 Tax=Limnovirga soli TaxID=2656915 RepID=A0A8J8FEN2_9BACT|nr:gliding motility lipoprotein GldH [Limnovirga soli]
MYRFNLFTLKQFLYISCIILLATACNTLNVYEQTKAFPTHQWVANDKPSFTFTITDTTQRYNIYAVLRHEDAYHFNNLWMNVSTLAPGDTLKTQQVQLLLGDNTKGWLGSAMDDIIEHRILLTRNPVALKKGKYIFTIQHTMREDPLQYILNAGIRVEKVMP